MRVTNIARFDPPQTLWREHWEFRSPNGRWRLVFQKPIEFHMSATSWSLSLFEGDQDVSQQHTAITLLRRFAFPETTSPWSSDSRCIALMTWDDTLALYEVSTRTVRLLPTAQRLRTLRWSPQHDLLLAISNQSARVLDRAGKEVCARPLRSPSMDGPFGCWWPSGEFLCIGRTSDCDKTALQVFDRCTAELVDAGTLDPIDLAPYASERYAWVPRDQFSLLIGEGTLGAGSLLDRWEYIEPGPGPASFALVIHRPTGMDPIRSHGARLCPVERQGVIVECAL